MNELEKQIRCLRERNVKLVAAYHELQKKVVCENAGLFTSPFMYIWEDDWKKIKKMFAEAEIQNLQHTEELL